LNFSQDNQNGDNFFDSFKMIANAVAALPDAVELILVVLLPKGGTVANLRPNNDLAKMLEQSFIDDSMVRDVPLKLDLLIAALTEFRRAFRAGSAPFQPQAVMSEGTTDRHLIDVVRLAHQSMQR
jgi:hypothetical protein